MAMGIEASTVEETYRLMQAKLSKLVPDVELRIKAELVYEINRRKKSAARSSSAITIWSRRFTIRFQMLLGIL